MMGLPAFGGGKRAGGIIMIIGRHGVLWRRAQASHGRCTAQCAMPVVWRALAVAVLLPRRRYPDVPHAHVDDAIGALDAGSRCVRTALANIAMSCGRAPRGRTRRPATTFLIPVAR